MRRSMIAVLFVASAIPAMAQTNMKPANNDARTPAVNTPNTPPNPAAPVAGANSFTEGQAKSRIESSIMASNADNWYDAKTKTYHDLDSKDDRAEGAATGGGIGAAAGGAAGLLAGLGLIAIPGVGPVVAAGWLVATLTGALAGGATGGVIGALTQQAGLSKEDADLYAEGLRRGGAVVSARVGDADASRYQAVMDRSSVKASDRADAYRKSGWTTYNPTARPYSVDEVVKERSLYR